MTNYNIITPLKVVNMMPSARYSSHDSPEQWKRIDITIPDSHNGYITYVDHSNGIWQCKLLNNEWYLHHDSEPAIIQDNVVWFFHNGVNMNINDMPIDDELKLLYTLKYEVNSDYNDGAIFSSYTK
jgi:hypothetical protein